MIESVLAALAPAAMLLVAVRFAGEDLRRASLRWFIPVTLLMFAPYWMTDRIPAPLDFLAAHIVPWMRPGVAVQNALQSDVVTQMLPWREVVAQFWRHGEWPFVNPYAGSGTTLWSNPSAAVLQPLTLLGLPFSTFAWANFVAVARMLIALTGMFVFLRDEGRSERAAIFGAIAYAFSALNIAFLLFPVTNVTTMLPWMLVAICRQNAIACAIVTALLLLGGHHESVVHVAMLAIPYALFVARGSVLRYALAAIAGLLLAAPVVVPFAMALPGIERVAHPIVTTPFELAQLLPFVFPARFAYTPFAVTGANFNEVATQYAGFAAFVLCAYAIVRKPRELRFWIVMLTVLTLAAFVPGVFVQMARVRFVIAFVVATLAAYGLDLDRDRRLMMLTLIAIAVVIISAMAFWPHAVELQLSTTVVATVAAAIVSAIVLLIAPRLITVALCVDLALLLWTSIPPHGRAEFYPETGAIRFLRAQPGRFRIAGVGGSLFPNVSTMFRIADIRVHDPMASEEYMRELERAGLDRRSYFELFHGFPSPAAANALGVRYFIAPPGVRSSLPSPYRGEDAVIFLNSRARDVPDVPVSKPRGWMLGWLLALAGVLSLAALKRRNNAALAPR